MYYAGRKIQPLEGQTHVPRWPRDSAHRISGIWLAPLLLLFVVGGAVQYAGLLSPTECDALTLLFFCALLRRRSFWRTAKLELAFVPMVAYFVVSGFVRGTALSSATAVYLYYSACLLLAAPAGRLLGQQLIERGRTGTVLLVIAGGLLLELPVTALQHIYAPAFAAHANVSLGAVDAVFGTFHLHSDATLAGCCLMAALVYAYATRRLGRLILVVCMAFGVIFLGHSDAMQGAAMVLLPTVLAVYAYQHTALHRYRRALILASALIVLIVLSTSWRFIQSEVHQLATLTTAEYIGRNDWITAGRLAPYGQLLHEGPEPLLFGHGALTYYNPITKQWLYNAGFSTFYSLSIDFGLIALIAYIIYQVRIIFTISPRLSLAWLLFAIWFTFIVFNDVLSNVGFIFALNFTLSFVANYLLGRKDHDRHITHMASETEQVEAKYDHT